MSKTISISPLTRIEGHLAITTETREREDGRLEVTDAHCEGEMFRGIESILQGRDPLDAQQITQRICGVCPVSHGIASVRAQEDAYGIVPNRNGRLLQNLILAANYLQSHVLHFYHLAALDFVDVTAVLAYEGTDRTLTALRAWVQGALDRGDAFAAAPLLPRWEADYIGDVGVNCALIGHYAEALDIRKIAHEMGAVFAAKLPHSTSIVPGGCTQTPTMERVLEYGARLKKIEAFINDTYLPDVITAAGAYPRLWDVGRGYDNFLSYGVFEMNEQGERFLPAGAVVEGKFQPLDQQHIAEEVGHSRFSSGTKLHPSKGNTEASPHKSGAYSWLKAPRYQGHPMEVGPLARILCAYHSSADHWVHHEVNAVLSQYGVPAEKLNSVLGRHLVRALEAVWVARQCHAWLAEIDVGAAPARDFEIPEFGSGIGLTEAPRGALGHWLRIENHLIANYQCIVPTTWNCSPRDDAGRPGPVEKALEGTIVDDPEQPMDPARIVRAFDPCIACAVH